MLNIPEPVPHTEPIPSNSRNSVYHFQHNSGIPGITADQFNLIPGIPFNRSDSIPELHRIPTDSDKFPSIPEFSALTPTLIAIPALTTTLIARLTLTPTPCNSGTEFRELGRTGIKRNY
ncbi:unnamed protein product [Rotaria magnacalcarata]|uniref:Uncharacterized protein n=1 Tax=Rotaria magnacalcarata TaxID=392030 RepID=A0A816M1U5_9BILA|nr:unnamed protein product [Rotaria magnacalcarata]